MRNLFRNILIFLLFILTAYQISSLWLNDFSISNFFSMFKEKEISTVDTMDFILDRIIVNVGENRIVGQTDNLYTSEYKQTFDRAITECINKGSKKDIGQFDWNNILSSRAVIYEYNCNLESKNLPYLFGSSIKNDKISDITTFNNIILKINTSGSSLTAIFYSSKTDQYTAKEIKKSDIISETYKKSTDFAESEVSDYISSVSSGFDIFSDNIFIPGWQENGIEYNLLSAKGMYTDESMAEKNAEDFFDNPVAKWSAEKDNILTYSDENTVVKYNKNSNVMEYSSYKVDSINDNSFSVNYISAINTIARDSFIKNEYYLDSYSSNAGRYTFRFNYKSGDKCLVPNNNIKKKTSMESFIEVVTEMGKPVKYRKYAYYYENSGSKSVADCNFVTAIEKVYSSEKIDNINLCLIADTNNMAELNWIIKVGDNEYEVPAKRYWNENTD